MIEKMGICPKCGRSLCALSAVSNAASMEEWQKVHRAD